MDFVILIVRGSIRLEEWRSYGGMVVPRFGRVFSFGVCERLFLHKHTRWDGMKFWDVCHVEARRSGFRITRHTGRNLVVMSERRPILDKRREATPHFSLSTFSTRNLPLTHTSPSSFFLEIPLSLCATCFWPTPT